MELGECSDQAVVWVLVAHLLTIRLWTSYSSSVHVPLFLIQDANTCPAPCQPCGIGTLKDKEKGFKFVWHGLWSKRISSFYGSRRCSFHLGLVLGVVRASTSCSQLPIPILRTVDGRNVRSFKHRKVGPSCPPQNRPGGGLLPLHVMPCAVESYETV